MHQITMEEPQAPRRVDPTIPIDLETIILKSVSKQPHERYRTALELANDLRNFLDRKPLLAKPPTLFDQANKLAARHPRVAIAVAVSLLLVTLSASAGLIWSRHVNGLLQIGQSESAAALKREQRAKQDAVEAQHTAQELLYAADVRLAADGLQHGNVGSARVRMARHIPKAGELDRRGFAWHYVWNEIYPEDLVIETSSPIRDASYSPDGSLIAAGHDSGEITLWDAQSGNLVRRFTSHLESIRDIAFSPDRKTLACADWDGVVTLCSVDKGAVETRLRAFPDVVETVLFGPDGTLLTAGADVVKLWRDNWD